ncbi:MAG: SRPBCC family protein [Flavobacteriaceae bacterium]|nr:SRPBCC family protein [Flavobacteriaceae bacterium]
MKYTTEIIIELPRKEVIKKLDSTENIKHWQRGLISADHLSGKPGETGAKMNLKYKMGKREMEMIETITKSNFPDEFHAHYDAKGVHNIQENFFEDTAEGHTKWISKSEFQFEGFMMKMMGFLMPGAFKKQSMKYAVDFKNFAEKGISVLDAKK